MALPATLLQHLHEALLAAFPTIDDLRRMMMFELDVPLAHVTAEDLPLPDVVFRILAWAEKSGRTGDLVDGATRQNPGNALLLQFRQEFLRAQQQHPQDSELRRYAEQMSLAPALPPKPVLERIVVRSVQFHDVPHWRAKLGQAELAVCQVRLDGLPVGTGFLVGPDMAITNAHVLPGAAERGVLPGAVRFVFDFKVGSDGQPLAEQPFEAAANWRVASSAPDDLDFVLIRLSGAPGHAAVGGTAGAPARGWLMPVRRTLEAGEPILILQHPVGASLKLAVGAFVARDANRVAYNTNTEAGSSGAPCFDSDLSLVALHRGHSAGTNEGVPFGPILDLCAGALGPAFVPGPPFAPVARPAESALPAVAPPPQIHAQFKLDRGNPVFDEARGGWKLRLLLEPAPVDVGALARYTLRDLYGPGMHQTLESEWARQFRTDEFACRQDVAITVELRSGGQALSPMQSFLADALRRTYTEPPASIASAIAAIAQNW